MDRADGLHSERIVEFQGISNCRDLGGLPGRGQKKIRPGRLLRSAHLHAATPEDVHVLVDTFHLSMIVDLRTAAERVQMPDMPVPGAQYRPMSVFEVSQAGITHEQETERRAIPYIPDMARLYRSVILSRELRGNVGMAVRELMGQVAADPGAVLWHCTEGKDRCGILSAALLLSLGVSRDLVMEDYLLTNLVNKPKAEAMCQELRAEGAAESVVNAIYQAYIADERYMRAVFEEIDKQYGGDDNFLAEGLQIPEAEREAFAAAVLEG